MSVKLDPITTEILWLRLIGIVNEMFTTMRRIAFSSILREAADCSCTIFDAAGKLVVQSPRGITSQAGAMTQAIKHFLTVFPRETLEDGDVLITNDPWLLNGHKPDICVATPVFYNKKAVAFVQTIAHHTDIGGRLAEMKSTEHFEEGLLIPIMKLYKKGEENVDLFNIIYENVRVPDAVIGDLRAQVGASCFGATKIKELIAEMGWEDLQELSSEIRTRTETVIRKAIEELPDGSYRYEYPTDIRDESGKRIKFVCNIEIKGSDVKVDWEGTSPQVHHRSINVTWSYTYSLVHLGIKAALFPDTPNNAACFEIIKGTAPEGCILNCTKSVATWHRMAVAHLIPEAVWFALSQVVPEKVIAGSGTFPLGLFGFVGEKEGARYVHWSMLQGGMGAGAEKDGATCLFHMALSNTPIEAFENDTVLMYEKKELRCDSGGAGKHRGGLSQEVIFKIPDGEFSPKQNILANLCLARFTDPAQGLFGGHPGAISELFVNDGPKATENFAVTLKPGDTVTVKTGGGAGFGDPLERDPMLVERDVKLGYISIDKAKEDYGFGNR